MYHACECLLWTTSDIRRLALTGHHETCSMNPGVEASLWRLMGDFVKGVEAWDPEEGTLPEELLETYNRAKYYLSLP